MVWQRGRLAGGLGAHHQRGVIVVGNMPDGAPAHGKQPDMPGVDSAASTLSAHDPQDLRDQVSRLWSHRLHQDEEFVQRGNFFLVAESLLVVAYSGILTSGLAPGAVGHSDRLLLGARVIAGFGLLLSIIWTYVSNNDRHIVMYLHNEARHLIPDYNQYSQERRRPGRRVSTNWLMTFVIPALAGIMWLVFIIIAY
jgi:hypothetical protein